MGTVKGTFAAVGIVIVLFGAVWLVVPGLSARETRGVGIGAFLAGAALLAMGGLL